MLKVVNDNKIGSHVIMVPPHSKYVSLEWPAHNKRTFPKDNPTVTPTFNSCKPKAYNTNMNEELLSEVKPDNNILSISAEPWKVNTYKVIF